MRAQKRAALAQINNAYQQNVNAINGRGRVWTPGIRTPGTRRQGPVSWQLVTSMSMRRRLV